VLRNNTNTGVPSLFVCGSAVIYRKLFYRNIMSIYPWRVSSVRNPQAKQFHSKYRFCLQSEDGRLKLNMFSSLTAAVDFAYGQPSLRSFSKRNIVDFLYRDIEKAAPTLLLALKDITDLLI
jgi:hypothetical protein